MLIVAVMNGWSASVRAQEARTAAIVKDLLDGRDYQMLSKRALLGGHRVRRFVRYINRHNDSHNELLCVGKSLGGRNIVNALNRVDPLVYRRTALVTIDICWPTIDDWAPNRNKEVVVCSAPLDRATNVYLDTEGVEKMAGSQLDAYRADIMTSVPIGLVMNPGTTHFNIVKHVEVQRALTRSVGYLEAGK